MTAAGTRTGAALVAALLVCGPPAARAAGPAPAATGAPAGLTTIVRPDPAQNAAAVALWYRAPTGGFGPKPVPGLSRLAAMTVTASTPITGTSLGRLVTRYGGRLTVAAYPSAVSITALVSPESAAAIVRAMTADFFAPVVDQGGLQTGRRDSAEDALLRSFEPSEAIENAIGTALFADGPFHDGTIGTPATLAAVPLADVKAFAERAFRPANAVLVLTGNVDPAAAQSAVTRDGAAADAEPVPAPASRSAAPVVLRSASVDGQGLGWAGPPIGDEASATAMDFLAESLFAPKTGSVQRALGPLRATVTGKFVTYHDPGTFLVTIAGDDAAAALPIVKRAIAAAASPMPPAAFNAARAAFVYRLLSELQTPAELADTFGWYAVEGNAPYAPAEAGMQGRYFTAAAALTPQAVARVAARYLAVPPAVVTLTKAAPAAKRA